MRPTSFLGNGKIMTRDGIILKKNSQVYRKKVYINFFSLYHTIITITCT